MEVTEVLERSFGLRLNWGTSPTNVNQVKNSAQENCVKLYQGLYDAIAKKHNGQRLDGQLHSGQIRSIEAVVNQAKNTCHNASSTRSQLEQLQNIVGQYVKLLQAKEQGLAFGLKKSEMMQGQANHGMRHTLITLHGQLYENLTWVNESEKQHIKSQLGLFGDLKINTERSETRHILGQREKQDKVNLGQGGFGRAGFARSVDTNEILVLKKAHPETNTTMGNVSLPEYIKPLQAVNDGSLTRLAKVHDTYVAVTTSHADSLQRVKQNQLGTAYTYTELGLNDLDTFFHGLFLIRLALQPAIVSHWSDQIYNTLVDRLTTDTFTQTEINQMGLGEAKKRIKKQLLKHPLANTEKLRRYTNTMALNMLKAVNDLHQAGYGHNDIKPKNFILGQTQKGQYLNLQPKLIDFDTTQLIEQTIGQHKGVFTPQYAAPQIVSRYANNHPVLNDSYALGVCLRKLAGDSEVAITERMLNVHDFKFTGRYNTIKPVQNRRDVEAHMAFMPELCGLEDLSDLLCHPDAGKRITAKQAIDNPLFKVRGNLMRSQEFNEVTVKVLSLVKHLDLENYEQLTNPDLDSAEQTAQCEALYKPQQNAMRLHIESKAISHYGVDRYNALKSTVNQMITEGNDAAKKRRFARYADFSNWLKNKNQRQADYLYVGMLSK